MRKFLPLLWLLIIAMPLLSQGTKTAGPSQFAGPSVVGGIASTTVSCGENSIAGGTLQSGLNAYAVWTPCTTGSDSNGYSVVNAQIYYGTAAGTFYLAIYSNTTSACGASQTNCPSAVVCKDTTGVSASATAWNIDSSFVGGCGTLAANTIYWVGAMQSSATTQLNHVPAGSCPAGFSTSVFLSGQTAGTWPASPATSINTSVNCFSIYMVLNPL